MADTGDERTLRTSIGDFPLHEYRLRLGGREWSVLHTGEVLTWDDEQRYLREQRERLPYGVTLWPAAIALAHDLADRAAALAGRRLLELGAGTGLPGIVASSLGADVVQTDRHEAAMAVCRRNGARNRATRIAYRTADWARWDDDARYDWIVGSDILYGAGTHAHLLAIFERNLAAGGRLLLADPFRASSLTLLEAMEADGWRVAMSRWTIGERRVGVFELVRDA